MRLGGWLLVPLFALLITAVTSHALSGGFFVRAKSGHEIYVKADIADLSQPTFVLLHGITEDCTTFDEISGKLIQAGANVIRLDLIGHGRTLEHDHEGGQDSTTEITPDEQAEAVSDAIEQLGLENVILAGHSYGGGIAVKVAGRPEMQPRLRALHLFAPYVYRLDHISYHKLMPFTDWTAAVEGRFRLNSVDWLFGFPVIRYVKRYLKNSYLERWHLIPDRLAPDERKKLDLYLEAAAAAAYGLRDHYSAIELRKASRGLPIYLTAAKDDALVPLVVMNAFKNSLEQSGFKVTYNVLENTGHGIHTAAVEAVSQILLNSAPDGCADLLSTRSQSETAASRP